ncbi:MAG: hypothetical protein K0R62_6358 [Nonomuraea muscovyensis]|nr:hypothetical protein [Nonomuraea muscovyensis]
MRKLIVFLFILVVLLVAVDRVAVAGVERDLSNRIAAAADLSGKPTVTIEGVPFLTQAVAGRYPEVRFDLGTLTYGGVPVQDLRGVANDVTAPLADISGEVAVGANPVKFNAELRVDVADGGIRLTAERIEGVPDSLARLVNYTIPFKGDLPFDVKVTGVRNVADGLEFTAEATDVPFRG